MTRPVTVDLAARLAAYQTPTSARSAAARRADVGSSAGPGRLLRARAGDRPRLPRVHPGPARPRRVPWRWRAVDGLGAWVREFGLLGLGLAAVTVWAALLAVASTLVGGAS